MVKPDEVFKALADPTRREILSLLKSGGSSVGEIAANFHISRPAVSKHLNRLRAAGLVRHRAAGTSLICELDADPLYAVETWLSEYRVFWKQHLSRLKTHVEEQHHADPDTRKHR